MSQVVISTALRSPENGTKDSKPVTTPLSPRHPLSELYSPGNPKDAGASISSQGLSLTQDTSRKARCVFGIGLGMDSLTAPSILPASCLFHAGHRRTNPT